MRVCLVRLGSGFVIVAGVKARHVEGGDPLHGRLFQFRNVLEVLPSSVNTRSLVETDGAFHQSIVMRGADTTDGTVGGHRYRRADSRGRCNTVAFGA